MGAYYVGLDVHSRETVFVIQDAAGTILGRGTVPTTPEGLARLRLDYQLPPGTLVGLETGTSAFYVARALAALELRPVVVDAHEVRRKAHRPTQKSDRRDAFELCDGIRVGRYCSIVHIPSPAISTLRTTLSRRRHFVRLQTAEVNAAKRLLRGAGWPAGTRASMRTARGWDRLIKTLLAAPELQTHIRLHYAVWQQAGEQVRAIDHQLGELARAHRDDVRRLETVPGVGPIVALTAIAVFADVQRFQSAKHVASYAGLVPSTYNPALAIGMATSPSAARPSSARCCAKQPIMPDAPRIRSIRTSLSSVPGAATRPRSLRWRIGSVGCSGPCYGIEPTSSPPASASTRARSRRPSRVVFASLRNRRAASPASDMRRRSPLRVHDGACDPVLTRGLRAQETVWGQALRNAIWGELDPEWTAGDDAADSRYACVRPTRITAAAKTGEPP